MEGDPPTWWDRLWRRENATYVAGAFAFGLVYYVFSGETLVPSAVAGILWSLALVGGYRYYSRRE